MTVLLVIHHDLNIDHKQIAANILALLSFVDGQDLFWEKGLAANLAGACGIWRFSGPESAQMRHISFSLLEIVRHSSKYAGYAVKPSKAGVKPQHLASDMQFWL